MSSTPVNLWPALGSATMGTLRGAGRLTFGACGALSEGAAATVAPTLASGGNWIDSILHAVKSFSFEGNASVRSVGVFSEFWNCVGRLNFSGFLGTLGKLSPQGGGILALTVLPGLALLGIAIKNGIDDYGDYNSADHDKMLATIRTPFFYAGKLLTDAVTAAAGIQLLAGSARGGAYTAGVALVGMIACKTFEWFRSGNNPINNGGANVPAPFHHVLGWFKTNSKTHASGAI